MNNRTKVLLLATGAASFVLLGLAQSIIGPVLPVYAKTFGLDISSVGWLLSLFWTGCLLAVAAVYLLPDLIGPKSGIGLAALGTALMALMSGWPVVLMGAALFGAGYGVIAAVYNPRVLAAYGARGPAMMSLLNAIFTLGAIAAPQIFLMLGREPALTFWVFTGFAATILAAAAAMGDTRAPPQTEAKSGKVDWLLLTFAAMGIGIEACLVGLGPTALVIAGETEEQATQLLSQFFMTYLVSRTMLVFLAHRIAPFLIYLGAMVLTAGITFAMLAGVEVAILFPLIGFGCGLFFHGAYLTGLTRMGASTRVSALLLGAGLVGAILLPALITQVLGGLGPMGFFQIICGLACALVAIAALAAPRMTRR